MRLIADLVTIAGARLHRRLHGHLPAWDSYGYDGISPLCACRACHPERFEVVDAMRRRRYRVAP